MECITTKIVEELRHVSFVIHFFFSTISLFTLYSVFSLLWNAFLIFLFNSLGSIKVEIKTKKALRLVKVKIKIKKSQTVITPFWLEVRLNGDEH
jgi:hypothetical protein